MTESKATIETLKKIVSVASKNAQTLLLQEIEFYYQKAIQNGVSEKDAVQQTFNNFMLQLDEQSDFFQNLAIRDLYELRRDVWEFKEKFIAYLTRTNRRVMNSTASFVKIIHWYLVFFTNKTMSPNQITETLIQIELLANPTLRNSEFKDLELHYMVNEKVLNKLFIKRELQTGSSKIERYHFSLIEFDLPQSLLDNYELFLKNRIQK